AAFRSLAYPPCPATTVKLGVSNRPTSAPPQQDPEERPQRVALPVAHCRRRLDGERPAAREQPLPESVQTQLAAHGARLASPEGAREDLGDGHVPRCRRLHARFGDAAEGVSTTALEQLPESAAGLRPTVEGGRRQGGAIGEPLDGHLRLCRSLPAR